MSGMRTVKLEPWVAALTAGLLASKYPPPREGKKASDQN